MRFETCNNFIVFLQVENEIVDMCPTFQLFLQMET